MSTETASYFALDVLDKEVVQIIGDILDDTNASGRAFYNPLQVFDFQLGDELGAPSEDVLRIVREKVVSHSINLRNPGSLAHMVPPPLTISVIADLIIGALNQCAFVWEEAPLAASMEDACLKWMARQVGYPASSWGLLTSGGTASNCLAVYLALERAKKQDGQGAHRYCIISSDQVHFSIEKAAALCGLDRQAVLKATANDDGTLTPGLIRDLTVKAEIDGLRPILFVCNAGTTNAGVLEDPKEYLDVARSLGAWCHIDAAFGGFMALLEAKHHSVKHWAEADSLSWDPHKTLYVSYALGALLIKDKQYARSLEFHSPYAHKDALIETLKEDGGGADAGNFHLEGSRRFEALKLWMAVKHVGKTGFQRILEETLRNAQLFASLISQRDDLVLLLVPETSIVCFRYVQPGVTEEILNAVNSALQRSLFDEGGPLISTTTMGSKTVLRAVLLNPLISEENMAEIIEAICCEGRDQIGKFTKEENNYAGITCYQSAS